MKTLRNHRFLIALGLTSILLYVFFVKSFHNHTPQTNNFSQTNSNCSGFENVCKICDFVFSPFDEAEQIDFVDVIVKTEPQQFFYVSQIFSKEIFSIFLRAPPQV